MGIRTVLSTPLLREGIAIGAIHIRRQEIRPFSDKQIKLLETFADQAVIAIENARLISRNGDKTQARNHANSTAEALEQQTATSEILGVIASSPTNIQPVLDTVAANAARLCEATDALIRLVDGDRIRLVASYGTLPAPEFRSRAYEVPVGRAFVTERPCMFTIFWKQRKPNIPRVRARALESGLFLYANAKRGRSHWCDQYPANGSSSFLHRQIALLKTFAAQAVIAIENVRLFKEIQERNAELREALEHQTATAEVLGIISRRRRTCSRSSTPSSRAPRGFVGSMTWCCDSARGRYGSAGAFWSHPYRSRRDQH